MRTVSSDIMRELDRKTIEEYGVPGEILMDRAGRAVADVVKDCFRSGFCTGEAILLLAGKGNNGGDAYVAAAYLKKWGFGPEVLMTVSHDALDGDALYHFKKMKAMDIPVRQLLSDSDWNKEPAGASGSGGILVDGLLGTGISGAAHGVVAAAIRYINKLSVKNRVIAVDVPSGLNADTGKAEGPAVYADITVTMGLPKRGFTEPGAVSYTGNIHVVDIGICRDVGEEIESGVELICPGDLYGALSLRPRESHKGIFGHVLLIGGSRGYTGAVALAAMAVVRSGAGLLTVALPAGQAQAVAVQVPEAMVHGCAENDLGGMDASALDGFSGKLDNYDVVVMGPGMSISKDSEALVRGLLRDRKSSLVLDADALNVCAHNTGMIKDSQADIVITPHPGEMARLMNCSIATIQSDRVAAACEAAGKFGVTVILKGAASVVATPDGRTAINTTGNPGMATGGSGDVLSGILGALIGQAHDSYDAARLAVYVHGRAGDLAACALSQLSIIPGDLVDYLGLAFKGVAPR